jgi:hypothetical protein
MTKLRRLATPAIDRMDGYLTAAQHAFIKGEFDVTLEAVFFEILDGTITEDDIVIAAYSDFNPIEQRHECSLEEMITGVQEILSLPRRMWNSEYSGIPNIIEKNLRDGYWEHLQTCFDYKSARIVGLGHHVPYVNIGGGFTYVLYAIDMSKCALLVGNVCD